ncbi:hypothetical protein BGZ76_000874 [Entomortierella beljakovae]|nr:hypothetical protein BGZ76_000874 [Entomortierella beljakovae]
MTSSTTYKSQLGQKSVSTSARAASFIAACAVAIVSGTPYLYSTYANQLTSKLALTAVQSNIKGPLFGRLVDSQGPKIVGVLAALLLMTGYSGLGFTYSGSFSSFGFFTAFFFLCLIGMGSQAGYMTSVSTNAHNFHSARGIAMGVPIALFGLSALLFAQVNNLFYKHDTQAFMFLVAKAIGATILTSVIFLTVFPSGGDNDSKDPEAPVHSHNDEIANIDADEPERERLLQSNQTNYSATPPSYQRVVLKPISGFKLFTTVRIALLLFLCVLLLSGPGLMYLTNAGNVIRSLYRDQLEDPSIPPTEEELTRLQQLQNYHVSLISLCSCLGRFSVGLMSDLGKKGSGKWWGISRVGFLLYAGVCVWLGQTFGATVTNIDGLAKVSILVGLGYGSVFGVAPTIVSEWFGVSIFGTNWGWISVGNAIGGQFFNLLFGYLYDQEAQHEHTLECFGVECFQTSFILGTISSFIGVCLLVYLTVITRRS